MNACVRGGWLRVRAFLQHVAGSLPCPNILPIFYGDINVCLLLTEGCYKAALIYLTNLFECVCVSVCVCVLGCMCLCVNTFAG